MALMELTDNLTFEPWSNIKNEVFKEYIIFRNSKSLIKDQNKK